MPCRAASAPIVAACPPATRPSCPHSATPGCRPAACIWLSASSTRASCSCVTAPSAFIGSEQMRHHAIELQRRSVAQSAPAARPDASGSTPCRLMPVSISRCTGIEPAASPRTARRRFQLIELPRLPRHGRQFVAHHVRALPGKTPLMTRISRIRTSARAATPSSTLVTPSQRAPARTTAGAQMLQRSVRRHRPSQWPAAPHAARPQRRESGSCLQERGCEFQPSRGVSASGYPGLQFRPCAPAQSHTAQC